ncbi:MAG: excinuclease ABC subunit UvrA, partial [Bacilli bacterium]|nr:excinuclease ABC subunit UvrA [Bacilli bacterium]
MDKIIIKGARENNLKNVDIELPKNKMIVMTGLSGSGKSSLAFDTIYAEGERRYVESLSAYARQFLGNSNKPDVDSIEGLSPAISIDQKTTSNNPRSTVGTVTEIYDYLRLLFARVGTPYCPNHNIPITSQSVEEMTNKILEYPEGTKLIVMAPVVHGEKGTQKDLLETLQKEGYVRVNIDGETHDLSEEFNLDKNKKHNISVIIDRLVIKEGIRSRLFEALETSTKLASGKVVIKTMGDDSKEIVMSESFACPYCEFSLPELEPRLFSFNAPYGACPDCKGLGVKLQMDPELVVPDQTLSIIDGCIKPYGDEVENIYYMKLLCLCKHYKIDTTKPFSKLTNKEKELIFYGSKEPIHIKYTTRGGNTTDT